MGNMAGNKTNQTITLGDGRLLGYAEYGNPQGKPVFFFHGNPSSRLGGRLMDDAANEINEASSRLIDPESVYLISNLAAST